MTRAVRARWSVNAIFLLHGIIVANWFARIPAVQHRLGISVGALGAYLLCATVGALCGMPVTARLVGRFGSAAVVRVSTVAFCLSLPFPASVPRPWMLAPTLFLFGWCAATMDVSMNTQAVVVERRLHRPVMTTFHALFSIGGMTGSAMGGAAASFGLSPSTHLFAASALLLASSFFALRSLLADDPRETPAEHVHWTRHLGALWPLAIVAFCALLGEGAMADWTAVYLTGIRGVTPGMAAAGYAVFSVCMAAGRLAGDSLRSRFPEVSLIRCGTALACVGLALGLLWGGLWGGLAGFACAGFGFATIFPILTIRAGQVPGVSPQAGIATVAALGYLGFLIGPPLIGFLAQASSLRAGLGLIPLLSAVASIISGFLRDGERRKPALASDAAGLLQ